MRLQYHLLMVVSIMFTAGCVTFPARTRAAYDKPDPFCPSCHATSHGGHGFLDSAPVYTGRWEFVSLDGTIKTGHWTHQMMMSIHHMSREPKSYAIEKGKTGSLFMWWDLDKHHPCELQEYLSGKQQGYSMMWFPSGQLQFVGRIVQERMGSGVWFRRDGTREAEFISNGEDAVSIGRNRDGTLNTLERLKDWMPMEKP